MWFPMIPMQDMRHNGIVWTSLTLFYQADILNYHSFGCPLGAQLGSLRQDCGPDRRAQKSHKSRLCFFTNQTFSIFIPLAVPWCPNLDPCGKNVIPTGARKIHIKVVYVFCPSDISHFHTFGCPLLTHFGSLQQKCAPDRCAQNSHKSRLCLFTHQTFSIFIPFAVPWDPNLDPCSKSVLLTGARKTHIKIVYVFLSIRHFPFSFLWLSLEVPIWILATKVWSWQLRAKFT